MAKQTYIEEGICPYHYFTNVKELIEQLNKLEDPESIQVFYDEMGLGTKSNRFYLDKTSKDITFDYNYEPPQHK